MGAHCIAVACSHELSDTVTGCSADNCSDARTNSGSDHFAHACAHAHPNGVTDDRADDSVSHDRGTHHGCSYHRSTHDAGPYNSHADYYFANSASNQRANARAYARPDSGAH